MLPDSGTSPEIVKAGIILSMSSREKDPTESATLPPLRVRWLRTIEYREAWELQKSLSIKRLEDEIPDTLLLLEHPPTFTLGRNAKPSDILVDADTLTREGIEVVQSDRGGDVTYHGPGQLVGYPIVNLQRPPHSPNLHAYFRLLEETLIGSLARFEVEAERFKGYTGVWVGMKTQPFAPEKIAAMGIRVSRWVTQHGFALNVCPNMRHFGMIIPCDIRDYGVTSLQNVIARKVTVEEVLPVVIGEFSRVFGMEVEA